MQASTYYEKKIIGGHGYNFFSARFGKDVDLNLTMSSYCELGISEWKELESLGHERLKNDGDGRIDE